MRLPILLGGLLLFAGCSSSSDENRSFTDQEIPTDDIPVHLQDVEHLSIFSDFSPTEEITFTKTQTFGEIYPQLLPPQMGFGPEEAVDANGHVYRVHKGERKILVFNESGELIKKLGRDGRGPGEFQSIVAIEIFEDQLVVYDSNLGRISTFNTTSYELEEILKMDWKAWGDKVKTKYKIPQTVKVIGPEKYLISMIKEKEDGSNFQSYYRMNAGGQIVSDEVVETRNLTGHIGTTRNGHRAGIKLPFSSQGKINVSASGEILHMNTEEFLIRRFDEQGNLLDAMYYPLEKASFDREAFLNEQHPNMQPVYSDVDFPKSWPALETMLVDDENHIWVSTITEDESNRKWYIMKESGDIKAVFSWSDDSEIKMVKNGIMYARETDPETEAKLIVGYDIKYRPLPR